MLIRILGTVIGTGMVAVSVMTLSDHTASLPASLSMLFTGSLFLLYALGGKLVFSKFFPAAAKPISRRKAKKESAPENG